MDLWRLADRFADEVMLRPHKVSSQDTKSYNALTRMAMQFKNFTIKSLNGRTMRAFYESTKNHRTLDQVLATTISMGLAGGFYLVTSHLKAWGLPKEEQKGYLQRATNPKMMAYAALTRSSHIGAPLSILSLIGGVAGYDPARMVRTSILPKGDMFEDKKRTKPLTSREVAANLMGTIGEQIPSIGFLGSVGASAHSAYGVLTAPNRATEVDYMTGMMNATREMVPNDPLTQQLMVKLFEEQGVHFKAKPRAN